MEKNIRKYWKKLLALTLVLVLTVGLLPGQMRKVEAATEVELSVVSVHDQGNRYLIYLKANGYDIADNVYWNNNTYYLDGQKVETGTDELLNYAIDAGNDQLLLCIQYGAIESGATAASDVGLHTLLIPKGTVFGAGTAGEFVLANDLAFTIKGSEITQVQATSLHLKSASGQDTNLKRYAITMETTADTTEDIYWNSNTIYLDGVAKSGDGVNYFYGDALTLFLTYEMVESGKTSCGQIGVHALTIPCGTLIGTYNNTKALVTTNELKLSINGGTVTELLPQEVVTLSDRPTDGSTSGNGFYFVVDPADSYPVPDDGNGGWNTNITFASGGISIDGILDTNIKLKKILSNLYYVPLVDVGRAVSAGQIVTVDGSIRGSDVEVVFTPTKFIFTGTGWDVYTPQESTTLTLAATNGGGYQGEDSRWLIWLESAETVPAAGTYIGGLQMEIRAGDDSPVSYALGNGELLALETGESVQWVLLLPTSSYGALPAVSEMDADTEYRVTIKAGKGFSSADNSEVEIPEDVTILFREQAIQGILTYENTALLQRPTDNASGTSGIYFVTGEDDGLEYAADWNTRPNIVAGSVTVDGTKVTPTARSLVKITDTLYFFSFATGETTNVPAIAAGSKVTFDFLAYNAGETGRVVKFPKTTFVLGSDDAWTVYVPSVLRGDANGDHYLDVRDIVRLKLYLKDNSVTVDSEAADANGDNVIDKNDLIKLYEYLLEGTVANAGTAEAAYVMGDIPVYLNDIEIPLAAYQGPRAGGFTNYTYTPDADGYIYKNIIGIKTPSGTLGVETVTNSFLNAYEMQQYKDAGFTTLVTESDCSWTKHDIFALGGGMYANMKYYMLLAQDAGLDVIVTSSAVNAFLNDMDHSEYGVTQKADGTEVEITKALIIEDLTALVDFMNGNNAVTQWSIDDTYLSANYPSEYHERMKKSVVFDNFAGIQLSDEVDYLTCKDKYNYVAAEMKKIKPDCRFLSSNLLNGNKKPSETNRNTSLAEVLSGFADQTKQYTYDEYPFMQESVITGTGLAKSCMRGANSILTTWFSSLSGVAKAAKANGVSTGITLQSFGMDNATNGTIRRAPGTQAEMSWQVYTALAYGMKEINYFTYWEHKTQALNGERHTGSMVRYPEAGEDATRSVKTDLYTFVQTINKEISMYDHVFMDFDWQASQVLGSNGSFEYIADATAISDKASFTNSSGTALVSAMKDNEKDVDGFWIVNAADPASADDINVKAVFTNATHVMTWIEGKQRIIALDDDGSYNVKLGAGEGQFLIPVVINQ